MPSLLFVVFALQLSLHLINTLGVDTINQLLWILYNKLPTPTSSAAQKAQVLKREVLRLKREMGAVSAQDDFARWAKLRRQHDKALGDYEKIDGSTKAQQTKFFAAISTIRWVATSGTRLGLQFWYSKQPMFWLPEGWVPGYVEWVLSFPRAPKGSVSINIWDIACASMIALVSEAISAAYVLITKKPVPKAEPVAMPADLQQGKKEL
ncbi:CHD5-like protein-domain-containing protein [Lophiotrema nucula]|uniref:CHD5-like protein-domain-containing protein n=1 Tax=Lophiotrema nucula TaxID=690887 RepID=A0A6A5YMQ2_9PLEO|nr:CHD5-like protein-domain-containing protein [Lophiotrema nucula]